MTDKFTDFGFKDIECGKKEKKVQSIFSDIASKYDVMNDFMSLGLHRIWKKLLVNELSPDRTLLDMAGGTGDIARHYILKGGQKAVVCDLNQEMLKCGRDKVLDSRADLLHSMEWVHASAEKLPFQDCSFDYYSISFGIRNVTDKASALREAYRVLKPGGKFICLEFSSMDNKYLQSIYDLYSFNVIPILGKVVAGNSSSYRYLVESIRRFPSAREFSQMIEDVGFGLVKFQKLSQGIVAFHIGYKI